MGLYNKLSNQAYKWLGFVIITISIASYFFVFPTEINSLRNDLQTSNNAAKEWLWGNMRDNGLFVYRYDPQTAQVTNSNNDLRQLLASKILAEESAKSKKLKPLHKKNLDFIFSFWYLEKEVDNLTHGYVQYNGRSKLGTNAMLLRTLVASPLFDQYEDEVRNLVLGIMHLQNVDGSFEPWYVEPSSANDKERLLWFYSGEAILALVELYERTRDELYLEAAVLSQDFYIEEYVYNIEENYYPAYVPWHTLSMNKLYKITGDPKYVDSIFIINDKLLEILDTENIVGRFYDPDKSQYGSPHTSSDAVYTEGLAYAYEIAKLLKDEEHTELYKNALFHAARNIISLQYMEAIFPSYSPFLKYKGAIAISNTNPEVRVDTVTHTIDAFTKFLEVL